jgi:hypothetical protein
MQLLYSNTLDALRRVQVFLDAQAAALGTLVPPALRARLDAVVTQLLGFQAEQSAATGTAKGETANQVAYRKDIRTRFLTPIAGIAKRSLRNAPEYPTMVVPSSLLRNADYLNTVQTLADSAAKHEKELIAYGMPADFLTQLRAAIAQLSASKDAQGRNLARRKAATDGIVESDKAARGELKTLNAVIAPAIKTNAALLADWKASKKIAITLTPLPPQPTGLAPASPALADGSGATPVVAPAPQAAKPAV